MAGHSSEKRWIRNEFNDGEGTSILAQRVCSQTIDTLNIAEEAFKELQDLFIFAGGTVQALADQLFIDDYSARSVPGTQAVITVDIAAGIVSNPIVTAGGIGYADGTGLIINLTVTGGGGDGVAQITYDVVSGAITNPIVSAAGTTYNDGTDVTVLETPAPGNIFETEANTAEVAKTQDLFDAITAIHELYLCADNTAVAQEDRFAQIRRMT